jgi:hypothetical protein
MNQDILPKAQQVEKRIARDFSLPLEIFIIRAHIADRKMGAQHFSPPHFHAQFFHAQQA